MWRWLLVAGCLAGMARAEEHWTRLRSGPFEVFTDAGARPGRETLVRFEEFRHALGQVVGETDLQSPQPIRILVFRNSREAAPWSAASAPIIHARGRLALVLSAGQPVPPQTLRALTRLLLDANTARMPPHFERGLEDFFSTLEVNGIRITAGKPPASPNLDWARVHLLIVDPEYYGRLRVLLFNLRKGIAEDAAYQNAFNKAPAAIEAQAKQHLAAGNFQTTELSSRPMSVERDFPEKPVAPEDARLALADLLAGDASRNAYQNMIREHAHVAEAHEGLAELALRAGRRDEARQEFAAALAAGSQSAECYLAYARLETDAAKAMPALEQAAKLNPKLAEPHFLMAQHLTDPARRLAQLKQAATLDARNATYWDTLARAYLDQHNFSEAAKAWRQAEQASAEPAQRERMRQAWLRIEQQRLDYEAAERRREEEEKQRELEKLKEQARAHVHELEAQANAASKPRPAGTEVVPWWTGPKPPGKVNGVLKQVDCLGRQARLIIQDDAGKTVRLLMADPGSVTLMGGGDLTLGCGPQKDRRVTVEYFPKNNARQGTSGEVATVEFR